MPIPSTPSYVPTTRVSWDDTKIYATSANVNTMANGLSGGHSGGLSTASGGDAYYCTGSNHECCNGNDVVLIKVGVRSVGRSIGGLVVWGVLDKWTTVVLEL